MNKLIASCIAITTAFISGCGGMAPLVVMPEKPKVSTELISATINMTDTKILEDGVVQLKSHAVKKNSSVVINVPADLFEDESKSNANNQEFKTEDFFNVAEQEIEKVFIGNDFRVLSRAKFEAKLRDLRDEARCDINEYRCLYSKVSEDAKPILDELKSRYEKKQISPSEYADQIKEFRDKFITASAGKSRKGNEHELRDISEVIRAAQSGDTRADYILQINTFNTKKSSRINKDIRQLPEVREFVTQYPAIKKQLDDNQYHMLKCAIVGAELNAKLIHVNTGEIIWIGNYELNEMSAGLNQITIELGQRTFPANEGAVNRFVQEQNSEFGRKARYQKEIRIPEWEVETQLIPLTVISGKCEKEWSYNNEKRIGLAREVAKKLISTIKVSAEQLTVRTEEPISDQSNIAQANSDLPNKSNKKTNMKKAN